MTIGGWVANVPDSIVRDKVKPGKYKGGYPQWAIGRCHRPVAGLEGLTIPDSGRI